MGDVNQIESVTTDESATRPQEEMVIDSLEVLRAISDPLRLQIVELLVEPRTVKELAPLLKIGKTKLYYHINLLEKHSIIRVVRTRLVSGIVEKSYQISAMRFRPAPELLSGEEGKVQGLAIFDSVFNVTRTDFAQSLKNGQIDPLVTTNEKKLLVGRVIASLNDEQAKEFHARLGALFEELKNYKVLPDEEKNYALTIAFFPRSKEK